MIGSHVAVAPNVVFRCVNKKFHCLDIPIVNQGDEYGEIVIKDDCWIASNATIASGTILNERSIVGANSFVNKEYPAYSIIAGCPARIIGVRK